MKTFFNEMLFALFCYYRKSNDAYVASFHSKSMIAVAVSFYILTAAILLSEFSQYFVFNFTSSTTITAVILIIPCEVFVYLLTDKYKVLEKKMQEETGDYTKQGWTKFYVFFGSALALFFGSVFLVHNR